MIITAALLLFLTGVAHSYLGERYILIRLFKRDNVPRLFGGTDFTTGTLRFVWHLLTIAWWGVAALVFQASAQPLESGTVLEVFSVVAFFSGVLAFFFTRGRHLSWVVFFTVATLLWCAAPGA
jgi:hypothetical protein